MFSQQGVITDDPGTRDGRLCRTISIDDNTVWETLPETFGSGMRQQFAAKQKSFQDRQEVLYLDSYFLDMQSTIVFGACNSIVFIL